jgi:DNA repair protein RadC
MEQFFDYTDVDLLGLIVGNKNYSLPNGVDFLELMENPVEYLTEKQSLKHEQREKFYVLFLNRSNVVKNIFEASAGGVSGTVVDVKIIAKKSH